MSDAQTPDAEDSRDPEYVERIKAQRAATLARGGSEQTELEEAQRRHLLVRLGGEHYGLPIEAIEELHFVPPVTALPGVPRFVLGAICLAGEALTLIDLTQLFGALPSSEEPDPRVIVARHGAERVALRVDAVEGIRTFPAPSERERPDDSWLTTGQVTGVAKGSILLLDVGQVLSDQRLVVDQTKASC